jgi:tricorn protease
VFDDSGDVLYFFSSTDAGPVRQWFALSNADMQVTSNIYLAVLPEGVESPLKKESDEEEVEMGSEGEKPGEPRAEAAAGQGNAANEGAEEERIEIDFENLDQRIVAVPVESGNYSDLQTGAEGQIYYIHREGEQGPYGPGSLKRFDLDKREDETLAEGVVAYRLSADHGAGRHARRPLVDRRHAGEDRSG